MNDDEFMPDEVRPGRRSRFRFTRTGQWALLMAELSDAGYRAYSLLVAHVSTERDDVLVWPHQRSLADMLGKRPEAVGRVVNKELVPLGLVDVREERYGANNSRRRNVYTVHEEPPPGWEGYASIQEWYAANKPKPTKAAGQPGHAKNRVSGHAKNRASGHAKDRVSKETKVELDESDKSKTAPAARSAADARRATAGSSADAPVEGGCAASGDGSSSDVRDEPGPGLEVPGQRTGGGELAGEQVAAVRELVASLPAELVALLPYRTVPKHNRAKVLEATAGRTPQQIADRVARRWVSHGYADTHHSADGKGIGSPVGVTLALIAPTACVYARCEDGADIDTGQPCPACLERQAERRAARKAAADAGKRAPAARPAPHRPGWWICAVCEHPGQGTPPRHGECASCRADAAAAAAAGQQLAQQLEQEAAARAAEAQQGSAFVLELDEQAAYAEAAERTDQDRTERERAARQQAEAEETARIRAELIAQHPELAAVSASVQEAQEAQQPASAPF